MYGPTRGSPKWRGFAALSLITAAAAIAACSDTMTAPVDHPVIKGTPTLNFTWQADERKIPDFGGPLVVSGAQPAVSTGSPQEAAYNYCITKLNQFNNWMESDQQQALVWDTAGVHVGGDTLFKARMRIKYRFYYGTYTDGKELRCIVVDSVTMYRKATQATGYGGGQVGHATIESGWAAPASFAWKTPSGDANWCWGGNLASAPFGPSCDHYNAASVFVYGKLPFGKRCNLYDDGSDNDVFNLGAAGRDSLQAGGLPAGTYTTWSGGTPLYNQTNAVGDNSKWEVQLFAKGPPGSPGAGSGGWWTVNDYGAANSPYSDGWRNSGPPLYQEGRPTHSLCNRYNSAITVPPLNGGQAWYNFHGGPSHWAAPSTPSSW